MRQKTVYHTDGILRTYHGHGSVTFGLRVTNLAPAQTTSAINHVEDEYPVDGTRT
jgi:hypothetical protein